MNNNYRNRLFDDYGKTHIAYLDGEEEHKKKWFLRYGELNYLKHINSFDRNKTTILEIGCNRGYLLYVLNIWGFTKLFGIDLSPDDVEKAQQLVPMADIECGDACMYLDKTLHGFDIIILKAVLEHVHKNDSVLFLEKIKNSINPGGMVIIDVPNMDWLFASHERYMDFTHEVGFTPQSLAQIMRAVFPNVRIHPADHIILSSRIKDMRKRLVRRIMSKLLSWADPAGVENYIWYRSIIGIGKND